MRLAAGTRIGPYEIVALLGAGGMGEVYRARDTQLQRDVALKVLPDAFAHDPDRLARFKREAQVLAALNHPNIAAIHGFEDEAGAPALVLELVEGPTLADRIAQGPIEVDEAVRIASQIADALAAAHEQGIIHRDLKPANIKLREDGTVKVLDFGLAKAFGPAEGGHSVHPDLTASPTITSPAMVTGAGVILGTAAYMAPEQARGKAADRRADIWAFGCVLYEMVTGNRAFDGEEASDVLAAVLRGEPDWLGTPARLLRVLRACLEKDRTQRLQAIGDFRLLLDEALTTRARARQRPMIWMAAAAMSALLAMAIGVLHFLERPPVEPMRRLQVAVPPDARIMFVALSPDGRQLILSFATAGPIAGQLWRRSLDSSALQAPNGTVGARTPFWSPDGRTIGFFADGKLKTMPASGGPSQALCDAGLGTGGTWNQDDVIVFGTETGSILRVSASGGACTPLIEEDGDRRFRVPVFLPDGNHFVYVAIGGDEASRGLHVASLDVPPTGKRILPDASSALFAPERPGSSQGHLLFMRESALMALPFDVDTLAILGDPVTIASRASFSSTATQPAAGVSADGTLVYVSSSPNDIHQLTWLDRSGKEIGRIGEPEDERHVALSPDQEFVATRRDRGAGVSIWLHDLSRDVATRLTDIVGFVSPAVWSPTGRGIVFTSQGDLYLQDVGAASPSALVRSNNPKAASDWSEAADVLVYTENNPKTRGDIWYLPKPTSSATAPEPMPFLRTEFVESQARLSPDGRWIAYASDESGQPEVYVSAFPSGAGKSRISRSYGRDPMWRGDGRELFYLEAAGARLRVMAVPITTEARRFEAGSAEALFDFPTFPFVLQYNIRNYSPTADGKRFLVNMQVRDEMPALNVITNWQELLSRGSRP